MEHTVTLSISDQNAIYKELIGLSVYTRSYGDSDDEIHRLVAMRMIADKLGVIYTLSGSAPMTWDAFRAVAPTMVEAELGKIVFDTIYSFDTPSDIESAVS